MTACWAFMLAICMSTGRAQNYIETYRLFTSLRPGATPLDSKVFGVDDKPGSMLIRSTDGTTSTHSLSTTSFTSVTVSYQNFDLDLERITASIRVQLYTDVTSARDGYLPLPEPCLGMTYVSSTWSPGVSGTSFLGVRSGDETTTIDISIHANAPGPQLNVAGRTIGPGDTARIMLPSNDILLMTSTSHALDGILLSASSNVSVYSGNWDVALSYGQSTTLIEMLPPATFFATDYVLCLPDSVLYAMIKIIALAQDNTVVTVTAVGTRSSTTANTLTFMGDTWIYAQSGPVVISGTSPIMVMQFIPEQSASSFPSMTLITPIEKWTSSYLVYPLSSASESSCEANVVIRTSQISGLVAEKLHDHSDITSTLSFVKLSGSDFSVASLQLDFSYITSLFHSGGATFQVIQYGGLGSSHGAYAFPAAVDPSCRTESNTSSVTNPNPKDESYFLLPAKTVYIAAGCIVLGVVTIIAIISVVVIVRKKKSKKYSLSLTFIGVKPSVDGKTANDKTTHGIHLQTSRVIGYSQMEPFDVRGYPTILSGSTPGMKCNTSSPPVDSRLILVRPVFNSNLRNF